MHFSAQGGVVRLLYLLSGFLSLGLAALGFLLPILPTVPFVILAAFCFARSNPVLERKLLSHRIFGPHIHDWRTRRAISRRGKIAAAVGFAASAVIGFLTLAPPLSFIPAAAALIGGTWVLTRPS